MEKLWIQFNTTENLQKIIPIYKGLDFSVEGKEIRICGHYENKNEEVEIIEFDSPKSANKYQNIIAELVYFRINGLIFVENVSSRIE